MIKLTRFELLIFNVVIKWHSLPRKKKLSGLSKVD